MSAVRWYMPATLCLALLGSPRVTFAQGAQAAEPQKVPPIKTADGVELRGHFYQCPKKNAPTVLVLHAFGEKSDMKGFQKLAETLQPNYSVMLFDFRGHGESKTVDPQEFWKYAPNKGAAAKGIGFGKDMIDFKNFDKTGAYLPVLANDIAAVKGYLDRRNDAGDCNTSSFILIGAGEGAILGSIWLNSEWYRYKTQLGLGGLTLQKDPEGKDTIAAVWISMPKDLGGKKLSLSGVLDMPGKIKATPMLFMYGEDDLSGKAVAKALEKALKSDKKSLSSHKYTGSYAPPGKTKLRGEQLLAQKSLKADAAIAKWLENVVSDKGTEWSDHDYKKSQYIWQMAPNQPAMMLKQPGENTPAFDIYDKFMR